MRTIKVKELKQYLNMLPEEADIKLGIKNYESSLVDILKSPVNEGRIIFVDETYLEDCKKKL